MTLSAIAGASIEPLGAQTQVWQVTAPRGEDKREIDFVTREGTWMSVDLSSDSQWIVFDLLGHVYRLPTKGGEAQSLTQESGVALNYHPRISPNGKTIAFISDRGGQDNLWIMNADGADPRPVHLDLQTRAVTPAWTPDGQHIVVRREPMDRGGDGERGLGIWMHPWQGGTGVQLVDDPAAHWPSVSPDGRHLYYYVIKGGRDRDFLRGDAQLRRLELATGTIIDITSGSSHGTASGRRSSGGAFAPEISPDGRWLAFARHLPDATVSFKGHEFGPRTGIWLLDLQSGRERLVIDPVLPAIESHDKSLRVIPAYAWAADSRSILISRSGGIERVDVASGAIRRIPFEARVHRLASARVSRPLEIRDGPFQARFLRWHTGSPDGGRVAFQAVGRVWVTDPSSGTPRRLTGESFEALQEFGPAWSPDGQWIAFTTWDDTLGGHVWKAPSDGGAPIRLTSKPAEYVHPAWSADGKELAIARGSGASFRGRTLTHNPWWDLVRLPVDGGEPKVVTRVALPAGSGPERVQRRAILSPSWGPDGRIFFPDIVEEATAVTSVRADGGDRRVHLLLPSADEISPSPDGRWLAYQEANNVYLTPLMGILPGAEPPMIDRADSSADVRRLSRTGGLFVRWRDAGTLEFGSGVQYYSHDVTTARTDTIAIRLIVPRRPISGRVALTNARLVTLAGPDGAHVLEQGTVVVDGARISCVGRCDTSGVDRVIDASGQTIVPGFVDMHAHHHREHRGYRPLRDYEVAINLAYGVTTNLDNSMWAQNIFPTAELIEAGRMIGPRTFSTGDPLPYEELSSLEATEDEIDKLRSWGAVSLKQHSHPRRNRRQWIAETARQRGDVTLTAEGYDLEYNIGQTLDGYTGWEHPLSVTPLYADVARFFGAAKTVYSNPFMFDSPTAANIEYFYAASDVWRQEKQRRWMPWRMTTFLRRRMLRPDTDYSFPLVAQGLADIVAEGGRAALGGHGEHHGTSIHWEIWMASSGLGPLGALRAASLGGATFLGVEQELGSLEVGKLADLLVLNANPLEDIRNTMSIHLVMKGGVLYEGDTLDEIWPDTRAFGPMYWMDEDAQRTDSRPLDVPGRAAAASP